MAADLKSSISPVRERRIGQSRGDLTDLDAFLRYVSVTAAPARTIDDPESRKREFLREDPDIKARLTLENCSIVELKQWDQTEPFSEPVMDRGGGFMYGSTDLSESGVGRGRHRPGSKGDIS